jgi:hypothetical protein
MHDHDDYDEDYEPIEVIPADPVFIRLCLDLQIARRAQKRNRPCPPHIMDAWEFERQAWGYLMQYLTTLECPPEVEPVHLSTMTMTSYERPYGGIKR